MFPEFDWPNGRRKCSWRRKEQYSGVTEQDRGIVTFYCLTFQMNVINEIKSLGVTFEMHLSFALEHVTLNVR